MRAAIRPTAAAVAIGVLTMSPVFLTGALGVQLRREFGVGTPEIGAAVSAFFLATVIVSPSLGKLADRLGSVRALQLTCAVVALSSLGIAIGARSFYALLVLLIVAGFANGIGGPVASLLITRHVRNQRSLAFGLKQAAIPAAALVAGLSVPLVALTVGWRYAYALPGASALILAATVHTQTTARGSGGPRVAASSVARGPLIAIAVAFGCSSAASTALSAFIVDLGLERGLSEAAGGLLLAAASVAAIVSRIVVGWWGDRPGSDAFVVSASLLGAGVSGFLLLGLTRGVAWVFLGAVLAFAGGWGWTGLMSYVVAAGSPQAPARAAGIVQVGGAGGGVLGPFIAGSALTSVSHGFVWAAAAALTSIGLVLVIRAANTPLARSFGAAERGEAAHGSA